MEKQRTIKAVVRNEPDMLMRVAGIMRRRGFRMKRILMEEGDLPEEAFMSITFAGEEMDSRRALAYLNRLVDFNLLYD